VARLKVWLEGRAKAAESDATTGGAPPKLSRRGQRLFERLFLHSLAVEDFEDDLPEHAKATLRSLPGNPHLSPLDDAAKYVACLYVFRTHMAHRVKQAGKYWVLDAVGPHYPFPLSVRTGYAPRWKRPVRKLERILKDIDKIICDVDRLENGLRGTRLKLMPCFLITDAANELERALAWMREFPTPTDLRSKYRKAIRPRPESESSEVAAYVLERLFRERSTNRLKVKDIECRIAQIESEFFGANVDSDAKFGCPAVRAQVAKIKNSKIRKALDGELDDDLEFGDLRHARNSELRALGAVEFNKRWEVQLSLLDEFSRHMDAYAAWTEKTQAALKAALSRRLVPGVSSDEIRSATEDYSSAMEAHLAACNRYCAERQRHVEAVRHLDGEFWDKVQSARQCMADCEKEWNSGPSIALVRNDGESSRPPSIPTSG